MTDQKDYRTYLELQFKTIHETLDRIEKQTLMTNGRVNEVEEELARLDRKVNDAIQHGNHVIDTRTTNCPNIPRFEKLEASMDKLHEQLQDAMFFVRHPKLFIGAIVIVVIASILTIIKEYIL